MPPLPCEPGACGFSTFGSDFFAGAFLAADLRAGAFAVEVVAPALLADFRAGAFFAAGLLLSGGASAASFTATTDMVVGGLINTVDATSDLTSSLRDDKLVLDARDDAARFVASQGDLRGAHLEAALRHIRSQQPELGASDLQLAQAILAL